jgi:hypothetical protein
VFSVALLDRLANDRCRDFQAAIEKRNLPIRFECYSEPQHLYDSLAETTLDLLLVHHTWEGVDIASIIGRVGDRSLDTRIIVFTGRDLVIPELIQCVRLGVADYWELGGLSTDYMLQRIVALCNNDRATLGKLRLASGPTLQLIERVEASEGEKSAIEKRLIGLDREVKELRSAERRRTLAETFRVLRVIVYLVGFTASAVTLEHFTSLPSWAVVALMGSFACFLLFLDGKLASAFIKWKGGSVDLKGGRRGAG